ncbi:uncharacterized protein CC84DRAFT_1256905 [Paraphaeosphaeria sporulosa]|uniref:Uncharacterized protein n=1 Tax=Paraphaeosphaeria sporulosa TaxID=1460663 RepID=A0A177CM65_9PLEO|nr:uncharacterized protein CC84DRAFT_1256905 [Paraphaeosphaeria sporulosa]OAG07950.1 hypothetical protein CC84DRAFT_1256905 [Paraphaeosphaeria sporulosa]
MSWTPENDRLLLLKLIETHGISVDSNKIVAAWPDGGTKPTARAITERFVKLRQYDAPQQAGIKVSITPGGASGRRKAPVSKYATPKKRKNKDSSDESDADDQATENESPTKKQSIQRFSGGRGRGGAVRGGRGGRVGTQNARSPAVQIKSEYSLSDLPPDPLDSVDTFARDAAEAAELRHTSQQNPFAGFTSAEMNGGMNGGFQGFDTSNVHRGLDGLSMTNGFAMDDPFTAPTHPSHGFHNDMPTFANAMQATGGGAIPVSRNRSTRTASVQASEGVAAVLRRQKDMDKADGEKSSGEDTQASEYYDLDNDYI